MDKAQANEALEQYLAELEKYLQDFPPSRRSKIVQENHAHVLEAKERFPDKKIEEILSDLGSAQKVANHYRLDHGLKTFKAKRHPFWKWLTIMTLGSMATFLILIGTLIYKFTPLMKVHDDRVVLLGGLIDVNGTSGKIKLFDQYQFVENRFTNQFDGAFELTPETNEIVVNFDSGIINFKTSKTKRASWNCKLQTPPGKDIINILPHALEINLEAYGGGSCDIEIPIDATLTSTGEDAEVNIIEPEYDLMVEFENGSINFAPSPEVEYNFDIRLEKGMAGKFKTSVAPNAYEVKLYLENGAVRKTHGP